MEDLHINEMLGKKFGKLTIIELDKITKQKSIFENVNAVAVILIL